MDVLVLKPTYPKGLLGQKHYFAGGVIAAFECKLTLQRQHIKRAFEVASLIKKRAPKHEGTPYSEMCKLPIYGLLAHKLSKGAGKPSTRLHRMVEAFQDKYASHPRELLDVICVTDAATLPVSKYLLTGVDLDIEEREAIGADEKEPLVSAMYTIHSEDFPNPPLDRTGDILAGLIHELTYRIAYEDRNVREWADHLSMLGFYGGIGRPVYWSGHVLSETVQKGIKSRKWSDDRWSEWSRFIP